MDRNNVNTGANANAADAAQAAHPPPLRNPLGELVLGRFGYKIVVQKDFPLYVVRAYGISIKRSGNEWLKTWFISYSCPPLFHSSPHH